MFKNKIFLTKTLEKSCLHEKQTACDIKNNGKEFASFQNILEGGISQRYKL